MTLAIIKRHLARIATVACFISLVFSANSATAAECNRACMADLITQYVDALAAHDPSALPLADEVKYTVNGQAATLGEGIWKTVTDKQTFRQDYLDVSKQVAASHVAFWEGENQILYTVLLHLENSSITGIETLVQRTTPTDRIQPEVLDKPIIGMNDPIPEGQKMNRANMVRIALTYPKGLRIGNFTDGETPFAPDCYRVENGWIAAQRGELYDQNIMVHPGILTSVAAVDEENGTVLLWMNFGHTGNSYGVGNALVTYEAFKVWGNQIHSINAFFTGLPINTARFWPSSDPVYSYSM